MVISAAFYAQLKQWIHPNTTVDKEIVVAISADNSYRHQIYDHSSAQVNVTVVKLRGAKPDTLVTKEFPEFKLKNLADVSKQFNETICIPVTAEGKGRIVIDYNVTYKWKGSILEVKNLKQMDKNNIENQLLIHI